MKCEKCRGDISFGSPKEFVTWIDPIRGFCLCSEYTVKRVEE